MIQKGEIDLDLNNEIFNHILSFMYQNISEVEDPFVMINIIEACFKLEYQEMMNFYLMKFTKTINLENILSLLLYSNKIDIKVAKEQCLNFFFHNKKEVMNYTSNLELPNHILLELLKVSTMTTLIQNEIKADSSALSQHIYILKSTQKYCDMRIKCKNLTFLVHKIFLSKVSPYFNEFIQENDELVIEEFDEKTVKIFVDFIYCYEIEPPSNLKDLFSIIKFSDTYEVNVLKNLSIQHLNSFLSHETALDIIQFCNDYHLEELKDRCWRILKSTNQDNILDNIIEKQLDFNSELSLLRKEIEEVNFEILEFTKEFGL